MSEKAVGLSPTQLLKTPKITLIEEQQLNGSIKDLIKIKKHLINLFIMSFIWIASSFSYYLINFQLKYFEGNIFVNTTVSSLSEMLAIVLSGISYYKLGIRFTLIAAFCVSLMGVAALIIWGDNATYVPLMVLSAKFGVSANFSICYLANA